MSYSSPGSQSPSGSPLVFSSSAGPELVYLWCAAGAGLVCTNHQVVTGLQIENFHWIAGLGLTLSVLLTGLVLGKLEAPMARAKVVHDRA